MGSANIDRTNLEYIEQLYHVFQTNPAELSADWLLFFQGFELGFQTRQPGGEGEPGSSGVYALVQAYRQWGHFNAAVDPLEQERKKNPLLNLEEFGLEQQPLTTPVGAGGFLGAVDGSLGDLLAKLRQTYCAAIGVEYGGGTDKGQRDWLLEKIEAETPTWDKGRCRQLLGQLLEAEEFEAFLQRRYPGQKRFSVEGGEAVLPLLHTLVDRGSDLGAEELVIGMAHRGRLNVLAHVLGKPYETIFAEFDGAVQNSRDEAEGDVKYHMGYSRDLEGKDGRRLHLSLSPNPSHLELVNPVIEGIVRAKQDSIADGERRRVVPVLIHGDAAFTGQGIVTETLNLSQLEGYQTGGTIHIIINNQLGYTAIPSESRYTEYPTDLAKEAEVPVFHVNANEPEAVVRVAEIAMQYRHTFKRDVLIDLWCYRRYGHNEADDPTLTQPLMYKR